LNDPAVEQRERDQKMSGMKFALWPLSMNVVSAKAARPRGAGSATGSAAAGVARVSSTTAIRASFCSWLSLAALTPPGHVCLPL
jgi:hypothetical protein